MDCIKEFFMDILTQDEADTLGVIEKYLIEPESVLIPPPQKTCIHYIRYRKDGQYYCSGL